MKSLEEIATKYKTQKVPHGYMPIYEKFFNSMRHDKIKLLEIGVADGASVKTWEEYFTKGIIIGIDKSLKCDYESERTILIEGDAMIWWDIKSIPLLDIIIDDGSHIALEQLHSFKNLWPKLKPGGYYIIEDLFTLYDKKWNPGGPHTIVKEIQSKLDNILVGGDDIQEVHWYGRNDINGIVFLRKRYEEYRKQPLKEFTDFTNE